jgi:hypothetical protein
MEKEELGQEPLKDASARFKAVQCPFALLYECYRSSMLYRLVSPNRRTIVILYTRAQESGV